MQLAVSPEGKLLAKLDIDRKIEILPLSEPEKKILIDYYEKKEREWKPVRIQFIDKKLLAVVLIQKEGRSLTIKEAIEKYVKEGGKVLPSSAKGELTFLKEKLKEYAREEKLKELLSEKERKALQKLSQFYQQMEVSLYKVRIDLWGLERIDEGPEKLLLEERSMGDPECFPPLAAVSPDKKLLAVGFDYWVYLFDYRSRKLLKKWFVPEQAGYPLIHIPSWDYTGPTTSINSLFFDPSGKFLLVQRRFSLTTFLLYQPKLSCNLIEMVLNIICTVFDEVKAVCEIVSRVDLLKKKLDRLNQLLAKELGYGGLSPKDVTSILAPGVTQQPYNSTPTFHGFRFLKSGTKKKGVEWLIATGGNGEIGWILPFYPDLIALIGADEELRLLESTCSVVNTILKATYLEVLKSWFEEFLANAERLYKIRFKMGGLSLGSNVWVFPWEGRDLLVFPSEEEGKGYLKIASFKEMIEEAEKISPAKAWMGGYYIPLEKVKALYKLPLEERKAPVLKSEYYRLPVWAGDSRLFLLRKDTHLKKELEFKIYLEILSLPEK